MTRDGGARSCREAQKGGAKGGAKPAGGPYGCFLLWLPLESSWRVVGQHALLCIKQVVAVPAKLVFTFDFKLPLVSSTM